MVDYMTKWWKLQHIRPPISANRKNSIQVVVCLTQEVGHGRSWNFLIFHETMREHVKYI
jgi:hypothetical protein